MPLSALLRCLTLCLATVAAVWALTGIAMAQTAEGDLAQAIRDAMASGARAIILNGDGALASATAAESAPADTPAPMKDASALMQAQAEISGFRETLLERLAALPNSLNEVAFILRATSPDGQISTYVHALLWTLVLLFIGRFAAVHIYGQRLMRGFVTGKVLDAPQGYREKMPFLVFRFVVGVGGTLFGMAVAYTLGVLIFGASDDISIQFTVTAIFTAWFVGRTVSDVWRMILSPFLGQYRIPCFSDRDAKRLYYWASLLAGYSVATYMFSTWIHDFGLNYNVYALIYGALSLVGTLLNIAMILVNKRAISNAILHGKTRQDSSWISRAVAVAWAPVVIVYTLFGWFELVFDLVLERPESLPLTVGAYAVFLSIIVVYGAINYVIESYFDRRLARERMNSDMAAADAAEEAAEAGALPPPAPTINTFEQLARRVAGILAFVAGAYALLRIWDADKAVMSESLVGRMLDVIVILFIGYVVYNIFRIWIDSKIAEETVPEEEVELGDEGGGSSASRLGTLLPLFRGAILAVVVVAIGLIALLEVGINVSPLFAGAGVVGLAVGFGAQTLVRDIFSGAFFLIDDAFRKGEYIDIESVKGTVEKISVRSFQLRHHLGALHTIPFGEIKVLTNYSRDWVMMKLPLRVTYDTDVEHVRKIVKKLGQQLLDDPVIGESFIQPLKSQGVIEMQDSAMIIRVKFMTKPGDQWLVRKKVYEEIRALFEREGIRFAHREVTVRLADGKVEDLSDAQRKAITGAAQAAIDDDAMGPADASGDDR